MDQSSWKLLRMLWPNWLGWFLLPIPALLFWTGDDSRFVALCCFFLSCTSLVVSVFRIDLVARTIVSGSERSAGAVKVWQKRVIAVGAILLLNWFVFAVVCLAFSDWRDWLDPVLALLSLVPSLCIAPYLTLALKKRFPAVVLTLFLMACMKFVAGTVTVLVYGWHATEFGYTTLTWTRPNLIVCTLVTATTVLCGALYFLGRRRFYAIHE